MATLEINLSVKIFYIKKETAMLLLSLAYQARPWLVFNVI